MKKTFIALSLVGSIAVAPQTQAFFLPDNCEETYEGDQQLIDQCKEGLKILNAAVTIGAIIGIAAIVEHENKNKFVQEKKEQSSFFVLPEYSYQDGQEYTGLTLQYNF